MHLQHPLLTSSCRRLLPACLPAGYPSTWCHFGCAAAELDPQGKFAGAGAGARNLWVWNAQRGGKPVPFASCCGPDGFSESCTCAPRGGCA